MSLETLRKQERKPNRNTIQIELAKKMMKPDDPENFTDQDFADWVGEPDDPKSNAAKFAEVWENSADLDSQLTSTEPEIYNSALVELQHRLEEIE